MTTDDTNNDANNAATGAAGPAAPPDAAQPPVTADGAPDAQPGPGKKDYVVGYKRPPRRLKGAIPNPKGRPRRFRPEDFLTAMHMLLDEVIKVRLPNGRSKKMTRLIYLIEMIKREERQGDTDAVVQMRLVNKIVARGVDMQREYAGIGKLVVPEKLSDDEWQAHYGRPDPTQPDIQPASPPVAPEAVAPLAPSPGESVSQSAEEPGLQKAKRRALERAKIKKAAHDRAWAEFRGGQTRPPPLPAVQPVEWWAPEKEQMVHIDRVTYEETWRQILAAQGRKPSDVDPGQKP